MTPINFLTTKELKPILAYINEQWGYDKKLDYAFILTDKERIYIINRAVDNIDFSKLRINSLGLYFGEYRNEELRLSIEGSQIIGPAATKNVVELNSDEKKKWLQGIDLDKSHDFHQGASREAINVMEIVRSQEAPSRTVSDRRFLRECSNTGFVIIKSGNDFFGCGKCKEGRVLNFVPKARRIMTADFASE